MRDVVLTQEGYIGLVPRCANIDDQICVLLGAEFPYILRIKAGAFEVVGECYCHGIIMEGEMLAAGFVAEALDIV